ncbi:hypothetical protein ANO11243_042220 [Dothideomycetidae sp. 11243]|nr:hypothetical protein ANO11243_042220 [fungal sp. No.11243]
MQHACLRVLLLSVSSSSKSWKMCRRSSGWRSAVSAAVGSWCCEAETTASGPGVVDEEDMVAELAHARRRQVTGPESMGCELQKGKSAVKFVGMGMDAEPSV